MHPTAWETREAFPKSRNEPPITLRVNGRPVFGKGSNWIPPEIFPCLETPARLGELVALAKAANFNLLRCWGGAAMPGDAFFEACDRLGVMAWVEFPLGCNPYPDDPDYLAELGTHARALVRRVRPHPSLALWCGGNELFNRWSLMTDQSLPLRLLNSVCLDLDPHTPFIPTSPLEGMAHGNYVFRYADGREVYEAMAQARYTAYPEFGMPGPSAVETLKGFIPADELFPPAPRGSWKHHHAFGAWVGDTWLCWDLLQDYFGPIQNLETLVELGQWLQCEGYKAIYEEARRQKPVCSMALNWCYNECWPCAANNSLLEWPARKKPAYDAVAAACRPVLASLRLRKFSWSPGETFECDLWLLNDAPGERPAARIDVTLEADGAAPLCVGTWEAPSAGANENMAGPTLRFRLPALPAVDRFRMVASCPAHPEWTSVYTLQARVRAGAAANGLQLNA
jgi:beta-mannosidase